jgi:DNA-binding transcriptional ArsR family regulator
MEDQYFFKSIDQIQATAEPTRWQILNLLIAKAMTGSQLARVLGIPRPLAHYHLKILEKVGLVEFQEERMRGGVVEKYFRAIARQFRSDHLVDGCRTSASSNGVELQTGDIVRNLMLAMLEVAHADLAQSDVRRCLAKSGFNFQDSLTLTQEQSNQFIADLRALADRYQHLQVDNLQSSSDGEVKATMHLRFTWLLTPVAPLPDDGMQKGELRKKREKTRDSLLEPY